MAGHRLLQELRGVSCLSLEEIEPQRKSICCSRSFGRSVIELAELSEAVCSYLSRAAEKLRRRQLAASYLSVFIRTNQFNADPNPNFSLNKCTARNVLLKNPIERRKTFRQVVRSG